MKRQRPLKSIVGGVEKAAVLVSEIAVASGDQATAIAQVNRGIEQLSQVVQTNSATSEEDGGRSGGAFRSGRYAEEHGRQVHPGCSERRSASSGKRAAPDGKGRRCNRRLSICQTGGFGKY